MRRSGDNIEQRAIRAETFVQVGELSHARQVLEGGDLAPRNQTTLDALRDEIRRLANPREPMPAELTNFVLPRAFELDESKFNRNLRSSRRGAAAGPSGMTMEHLRPLLDDARSLHSFFFPHSVVDLVRLGRLTALTKPDGGVRGIVAGDVVRRLVARTMSQQWGPAVERATSPYQYAMTTKAGCECITHALQGLTELDPEATITSIDGVGAFDLISRLQRVSAEAVPFARMFYGRRSEYLWESDSGEVHNIPQGEGGERGDAMMPLLFPLGQHGALHDASRTLDTYYVSKPARVGPIYGSLVNALWRNAGIRIHVGKTQIWNQAGIRPPICDALERSARAVDTTTTVWRGSMLPTDRQGIKLLGTPLGHPDFVARHLRSVTEEHQVLLQRIPRVRDLQSAWLLLLHCASARANHFLRAVDPSSSGDFARAHDDDIWQCTCDILHVDPVQARSVKDVASLPFGTRRFGAQERGEGARVRVLGELG